MQEESVENNKIHEIRLIVAGTRTFDDYVLMKEKLDRIILGLREDYSGAPVVIISGNAKGADQLGIRSLCPMYCLSSPIKSFSLL